MLGVVEVTKTCFLKNRRGKKVSRRIERAYLLNARGEK